jgi:thioredoxin reductase
MDENFDVVVIGGGAAGLSGALALARSRRSVLVVDGGQPRNAPAEGVHNFLTRDGTPPHQLFDLGRAEVRRYGGRIEPGNVGSVRQADDGFVVELDGRAVRARRILLATGARDELPDIPGLADRWGIDVLHCPYCHGWEVRGRRIGILATGPMAAHQALLFRQLSSHVVFLQHVGPALPEEQRVELDALGISVVEGEVVEVETGDGRLRGVRLADGRRLELDALAVASVVVPRAEVVAPLGLEPVPVRMGEHILGWQLPAEPNGATAVPGLWVAGNVSSVPAQVMTSAAAGLTAGAGINAELAAEDARRAVARTRTGTPAG